MYDELVATAEQNKFNAHCWRCQPNAPVCNSEVEIVSATTDAVKTATDSEHSLVIMPMKTTADQDSTMQRYYCSVFDLLLLLHVGRNL